MTKKNKLGRNVTTREFKLATENAKVKLLNKVLTDEVSTVLQDILNRLEKLEETVWGKQETHKDDNGKETSNRV